jgi:DNA-binding CsgD family transcriptional regulator
VRHWTTTTDPGALPGHALGTMVDALGEPGFARQVLASMHGLMSVASWSVYRTGPGSRPCLFMSASSEARDTTRDCWWAYLSGPYLRDSTWAGDPVGLHAMALSHITAQEVQGEHRALVYDAHGMAERLSIAERQDDGGVFAVNFYRHQHQSALADAQIGRFETVAPALLALARKHIALTQARHAAPEAAPPPAGPPPAPPVRQPLPALRMRLQQAHGGLTPRELDVCARLLQGMTHEGIASDLGISLPTVKTYRNRAFARLGIHFRNQLFARLLP